MEIACKAPGSNVSHMGLAIFVCRFFDLSDWQIIENSLDFPTSQSALKCVPHT
jgi:hypothetical protein